MSAADTGAGIEARGLAGLARDVAGGVGNIAAIAERMEVRRAETEYISTKALQSRLNAEFLDELRRQPVPENVTDPQKYYQETFDTHIKSLHSLSANRATTARSKRAIENMTMEETERLRGEVMKVAWGKEQDRSLAMLEASTNEYWQAYLLTGDVRNIARIGASIHMMFENGVIDATTKTKMLLDWDKKYQVELVRREITAAVNDPDNPEAQERARQKIEDYPGPEREKMQFRDEYRIDTHIRQRQREELAAKDIDEVMGMAMNMDMNIEDIQAEIEARENLSPTKKVEAFRLATWAYDLWRGESVNPFVETQNHKALADVDYDLDHNTGKITSLQDIEDR
ncbi:hypothetical protein [Anaerobaca lacustris]|uniref:Uncharacterized protein n=1 Tax=Anaerobaca lacustris TaxID=3044600 RepID=A0AAW6TX88_9BACT|nr:hypothetical protein [Sedimentisphaerales bacterium M17dextr]